MRQKKNGGNFEWFMGIRNFQRFIWFFGKEFVKDFLVRNLWRKIWFLYFFVRILKINDLHTCGTQLYFSSEFEKSMICTHVAHNYIFRQNLKNQWSAHMWHINFENIKNQIRRELLEAARPHSVIWVRSRYCMGRVW